MFKVRATDGFDAGEDTMLAVLFAAIVISGITVHYLLVLRPRQRAAAAEAQLAGPVPLSQAMGELPGGIFLQPTYTWSRISPEGELMVGVHPLLLSLVGSPFQLDLPESGTRVRKGDPLVWIGKDDRCLAVRSPVSGRILEVKGRVNGDSSWDRLNRRDGGWLFRVEADDVEDEVPTWMIGDRALQWTREKYSAIRDHLQHARVEQQLGFAMADGGELPVGILAEFDQAEWLAFQTAFLEN